MIKIHNANISDRSISLKPNREVIESSRSQISALAGPAGSRVLSLIDRLIPQAAGLSDTSINPSGTPQLSKIFSAMAENIWQTVAETASSPSEPDKQSMGLEEVTRNVLLSLDSKFSAKTLKQMLDASGVGWEAKLRKFISRLPFFKGSFETMVSNDFKGMASRMLAAHDRNDPLMSSVVSTIKSLQLLNLYGWEKEGKLFLPLPLVFPERTNTVGQLLIHLPKQKNGHRKSSGSQNERFRITFLLEMSAIGPLRVDLNFINKKIEGRFTVANMSLKENIEKEIPCLAENLKHKGYDITRLECALKKPDVVGRSLVLEILPEEMHSISMRV